MSRLSWRIARFSCCPLLDPIDARIYYKDDEDKEIQGIGDALTYILKDMEKAFDLDKSHILVTHFAVSKKEDQDGQSLRELMLSETSNTVGGLTNVTSDLFKAFDYVPWGISIPALLVRASACNIQEVQSPLMSKKPNVRKKRVFIFLIGCVW